jgi:hypothetical protein
MPLIKDEDRDVLTQRFNDRLTGDVTIKLFIESVARSLLTIPGQPSGEVSGQYGKLTKELMEEVTSLSPLLHLEVADFRGDGAEEAARLGVQRVPAMVFDSENGGRLKYYGIPAGLEFSTILEAIEALSRKEPPLSEEVALVLEEAIHEPVHLQVFVTPT